MNTMKKQSDWMSQAPSSCIQQMGNNARSEHMDLAFRVKPVSAMLPANLTSISSPFFYPFFFYFGF